MARPKPLFYGEVKDGKLELEQKALFQLYVSSLIGKVQITVEKYYKKRSVDQNRYYWGVVVKILADEVGYAIDEMHAALKIRFLLRPPKNEKQEKLPAPASTTKMSTVQFEEYLGVIRNWAQKEFNIYIPKPNEVDWDDQVIYSN